MENIRRLTISGLSAGYRNRPVLRNLNLAALEPGKITALVGPNAAEITGFACTPDFKTIFLNVQHPGNWPAYGSSDATLAPTGTVRPRAATVVIQKADGGAIGV